MNKQRQENLQRMQIALKYIKFFINSLNEEFQGLLSIEKDIPTYVKALILKGQKFNIEFDDDYAQYVLHTKNSFNGFLIDKKDLVTKSDDIQASLKYVDLVEYSGFIIEFATKDCGYIIKSRDINESNIFNSEFLKIAQNKDKNKRIVEVYYNGQGAINIVYEIRNVGAFRMLFELDEQEKALFPKYENNEEFSV